MAKTAPDVYVNGIQTAPAKKVKLHEKLTKEEIRNLIRKKQGKK